MRELTNGRKNIIKKELVSEHEHCQAAVLAVPLVFHDDYDRINRITRRTVDGHGR